MGIELKENKELPISDKTLEALFLPSNDSLIHKSNFCYKNLDIKEKIWLKK